MASANRKPIMKTYEIPTMSSSLAWQNGSGMVFIRAAMMTTMRGIAGNVNVYDAW